MTITVSSCALCRRVRDDLGREVGTSTWADLAGYLRKYNLGSAEVFFSDTLCDECAASYQQLMTYGRPDRNQTFPSL